MPTHFDRLPVELIHMVFGYMSNVDVVWSFLNINPRINVLIYKYYFHRLDFQSITKCRFDFICYYIDLGRIQSLTLSNDYSTVKQIQLFFKTIQLRNLANLRFLQLLSVTNADIYPILNDLTQLKHLKVLLTTSRSSQPLLLGPTLIQLKSLERLSVSHGDIFDHNVQYPLHNLQILDCGLCRFLELDRLQMIIPSLISLKIILHGKYQLNLSSNTNLWSCLERLHLTIDDDTTVNFNEIQTFLNHFQKLNELTLVLRGSIDDFGDGNRWLTCPTIFNLKIFNFIIELDRPLNDQNNKMVQIVRSFSTKFWREIKKWYIALTTYRIFTITCLDDQSWINLTSSPSSTSFNNDWFYSKVKRIKLNEKISSNTFYKFHNLEQLSVPNENILLSIENISQFVSLRHLLLNQSVSNSVLGYILKYNTNIDHLTLSQVNLNQLFPLKTILFLNLESSIEFTNDSQINELVRVFPSIRHLSIHIDSIKLMCRIVDNQKHLENGIFNFGRIMKSIAYESLTTHTRLNKKSCSFTYLYESNKIFLWINNSEIESYHMKDDETIDKTHQQKDKCVLQ